MTLETDGGSGLPATRRSYYYRREIGPAGLLPAIGAGVGAGLVTFYLARLLRQKAPLDTTPRRRTRRSPITTHD